MSVLIGSILLAAVMNSVSMFFRYSTSNENQILASNMAQQVIDNARNQQFNHLQSLLGGANSASQQLELYSYPSNTTTSFFPRPLLRNEASGSGMTYETATLGSRFNGTVTETLTDNNPGSADDSITVAVNVKWSDQRGAHQYATSTIISAYGIHN